MGIWDFVKEAGEFLGIGGVKQTNAEDLKANVEKLKLPVEGLDVKVDGDKVTVSGKAPSQEVKEKVFLALGNVRGDTIALKPLWEWQESGDVSPIFSHGLENQWFRALDQSIIKAMQAHGGRYSPSIDVSDKDDEIVVRAELPGLDEKDVEVTLIGNVLLIRGDKKLEREEKERGYIYTERSHGPFERDIPLGAEVMSDKVSAAFKNGVLTVTLPKSPEGPKRVRRILIEPG